MAKTLLMAVDLGTSFIKAGIYTEDGECIAEVSEAVKDYRPSPGVFIQKGEELYGSVVACMQSATKELGDRAGDVAAISFTGQMAGFMGVDKDWNDITTWSCSLDSRYMPWANQQMTQLKDIFLATAGTNFPQMAPKFAWFRDEFPDESKKIAKYLMISGYVIGKLGDLDIEDAVIDRSYISWTGLADVANDSWSDVICNTIGLDQKLLPRIVNSNTLCGKLSAKAAALTGLKTGIALVSGAGDKIAGCLGSATVELGDVVFEASSYGQISCCVPEYRPDFAEGRFDVLPSAIPGEFYVAHFAAGSGISLDWFAQTFGQGNEESTGEVLKALEQKALNIPIGSNGLMAVGLFGGSSMPLDGVLRGMWMGHDWSHGVEHFYHSLLESYSYDFALCLGSFDRLYPEYAKGPVRVIGGGAKSPLWVQMTADATDRPYFTINRNDCAMWGASILAGNAIGLFGDLKETAKSYIQKRKEYAPDAARTEQYKKHIDLYRDYLKELHPFYKRIQEVNGI